MSETHISTTLRQETPEDREFLYLLYASTREEELACVPWKEGEKDAFLRSQFHLQTAHFRNHYLDSSFQIIESDGRPIGRLYIDREGSAIHVIDIALMPENRGKGIGSWYLQAILAEASSQQRPVTLYVEKFNRVQNLYARLGFQRIEDEGVYWKLEWVPKASSAAETTQQDHGEQAAG